MELTFLGTGAGMPSNQRNVTSIALRLLADRGAIWLFDCGEGTQHQFMRAPLKLSKLEKIFITHLHGDHLFGLPGLLTSRAHQGVQSPLMVFGPQGIRNYIETSLLASQSRLEYKLEIIELDETQHSDELVSIYEGDGYRIYCALLEHRIESFGYRVEEKDRPGKLAHNKLAKLGIPSGPEYGLLKQGIDVTLHDGTILRAADYIGNSVPGRVVTIMGDTRACPNILRLAVRADVLVHEATFSRNLQQLAYDYHHSTTEDAARAALQSEVGTLIMTHISSRYQDDSIEMLLQEAQETFVNSYIAIDFWSYVIARKNILSPIVITN
ncbi:MAG: ribonuclease Z [Paenibacillaceae bacterium]